MNCRLFVCLIALTRLAAPELSGAEAAAWQLRAGAQVDRAGIFLHQVIESGSLPHRPNLRLADAPAPGKMVALSRARILESVQKQDPAIVPPNWSGALQVRVTRRMRPLDETELKALLTQTLQREHVRDRGELELRFTRVWPSALVPDEPLTMRILDLPVSGVTPNFIARFELRSGPELAGTWQVPLHARIWREVWVARSAQPRGRLLRDTEIALERRDILTLRDALAQLNPEDDTLELTEPLQAGAALTARSLRPRPVVSRGQIVEAVLHDGAMLISIRAEVLEEGVPGQVIRVRNVRSKREFRAKVANEQTVTVAL